MRPLLSGNDRGKWSSAALAALVHVLLGLFLFYGVRWQNRLTPLWKSFAGGCHLNRDIPALLKAGGFRLREVHSRYLQGPRPLTWVWHGWAD